MSHLTPEQQLLHALSSKRATTLTTEEAKGLYLKQLEKSKRSTLSDFQFGKIRNWQDFVNLAGVPVPPGADVNAVSYLGIRDVFNNYIKAISSGDIDITKTPSAHEVAAATRNAIDPDSIPDDTKFTTTRGIIQDEFTVIDCLRNNPLVVYNKHQEAAAAQIVRNLMVKGYRGQALSCRVGGGKTFILAAAIRELYERGWEPLTASVALYPLVYVTKASIVEQTERVLYKRFGLRTGHQVDVTNIEQFRAKFGSRFIKEDIVIVNGEEEIVLKWKPMAAPALIILDESQGVKNIDSKQSKIFQAYNDLEGDYHLICSSATLFTRVIESKVLAVATRLKW